MEHELPSRTVTLTSSLLVKAFSHPKVCVKDISSAATSRTGIPRPLSYCPKSMIQKRSICRVLMLTAQSKAATLSLWDFTLQVVLIGLHTLKSKLSLSRALHHLPSKSVTKIKSIRSWEIMPYLLVSLLCQSLCSTMVIFTMMSALMAAHSSHQLRVRGRTVTKLSKSSCG